MPQIVIPLNITFNDWANQLWIDLPGKDISLVDDKTDWRDFACQLFSNPSLYNVPFPYKEIYPDDESWRKWAQNFVNNIYL